MSPQHMLPLTASVESRVALATQTLRPSNNGSADPHQALDKVAFPTSAELVEYVGSLPVLSDDEEDARDDWPADAYVRGRRDSASSVATARGRERSRSTSHRKRERNTSKRSVPPTRRARPFKRSRACRFTLGSQHEEEADWSERVNAWRLAPSFTEEGFVQINPAALVNTQQHASTGELAELINLISDEAGSAKELDRLTKAVTAGVPVRELFEVSVKFAKSHIVVWDIDFKATYAIEAVIYVKDARPYEPGQLLHSPVQSFGVEWQTIHPTRKGQSNVGDVVYETSLDPRETVVLHRFQVAKKMDPANGIHAAESWEWIPAGTPGTCRGGGWAMRIWVPVPMSILEGRSGPVPSFVRATLGLEDYNLECVITVNAEATVTLENLRRERDMKVSGGLL